MGGLQRGEREGAQSGTLSPLCMEEKSELLESWNVENPVFNHFNLFNDGPDAQTENSGAGGPAPTMNPLRPFLERRSGREKILYA